MEIHKQTGMNLGNLSTLVKKLSESQLLSGDLKKPKLTNPIQSNFFDQTGGLHE
jgi:DNA-binding transcriptional regulator GbsR (MarR family)